MRCQKKLYFQNWSDFVSKIEFIIPIQVNSKLSLNSIYSGYHWSNRVKKALRIHKTVKCALINQKIQRKLIESPVCINFYWKSRLDLDNHGYLAKLIIDGLKGYLLFDDDKKHIIKISHSYWDSDGVKVQIDDSC